jgi:hypothetical protein
MQHDQFDGQTWLDSSPGIIGSTLRIQETGEPALLIIFPLTSKRMLLKWLTDDDASTDAA